MRLGLINIIIHNVISNQIMNIIKFPHYMCHGIFYESHFVNVFS